MAIFNNTSFRVMNQALDGVWLKQQVASQNLANIDTPNYKARTVNFATVLKEKTKCPYHKGFHGNSEQNGEINLKTTVTVEEGTNQLLDGNNVDAEKENMELLNAQIQYEALSNKVDKEFQILRTAMTR